ncbi:MAG: PH domain-containing protein [Gordonia sp. (in: high G+C Gram-positive bacteria)]
MSSSESASSTSGSGTDSSPGSSSDDGTARPELPQTFRLSRLAYFAVPAALLVTVFLAGASLVWLGWTMVAPILLALWIARIKTVVTADGLRAVGTLGTTDLAWSEIDGLQFSRWHPVRAVRTDGRKVRLPALTFGDLPRLSAASAGRIPDPFAGV